MDYGKLAYLKAVDLEDRLGLFKRGNFNVYVGELNGLSGGESVIADISGSGDIAVFVSSTENAKFYIDGVLNCEGKEVFFKLVGGGKITAVSSSGIQKIRFMALGNISFADRPGLGYADYNGSTIAYLLSEQGKVRAYTADTGRFVPKLIFEGDYIHGDICAYENRFIIAVVNSSGMVTIVDTSGRRYSYNWGAERVAISADDFVITVAYIKKGELYYVEFGGLGTSYSTINVKFNGMIDDIRFVKKSGKLLFSSGGKCYIKELGFNVKGSDKLYIKLSAEVL